MAFINTAAQTVLHTLVTEDASPALLADALPRFITGTMFARWMEFAHITKETLPAFSASVHTKRQKFLFLSVIQQDEAVGPQI